MTPRDPQASDPNPVAAPVPPQSRGAADTERIVVPVVEERVRVDKEVVETGRVHIRKTVREQSQDVEVPLKSEELEVRRIEVGRIVDDPKNPPRPRQEGDTYIVPVLEEVAVVEKRLVLREELHIRRKEHQTVHRETVDVRQEEAHVERLPPQDDRPHPPT